MNRILQLAFYRIAAGGLVPARWFEPDLPRPENRAAKTGRLNLEIVSHCWRYSRFLIYQLSSLALFPPDKADVVMTVFYCRDDPETVRTLEFFSERNVENVTWNWRELPEERLFRRSIGRNMAALETDADWVWFTDCDLLFREKCLDSLSEELQGRRSALLFPEKERCTAMLEKENPLLAAGSGAPRILDIDTEIFAANFPRKATGPLQIVHGDVCRAVGYCRAIPLYQSPSPVWCKAHEDRAFRWLLRSDGVSIPVPGVYRIKHLEKGRYGGDGVRSRLRGGIRILQSKLRDRRNRKKAESRSFFDAEADMAGGEDSGPDAP